MPKKFMKVRNHDRFDRNDNRKKNYSEHDNRKNSTRHVSFKPVHANTKNNELLWDFLLSNNLNDVDFDMGDVGSSKGRARINKKGGYKSGGNRMNSPAPRGGNNGGAGGSGDPPKRKLLEGPSNWYRVTIFSGANYDKSFITKVLLGQLAIDQLTYINWKTNGYDATFYLDNYKLAAKILNLDKKMVMPDGRRLGIRVYPGIPQVEITDPLKEKMKLAMAKRYNATTKALDLTKFHLDEELRDEFCALFRSTVMLAAVDVIEQNIPDLEALNLSDNYLSMIQHLNCLEKRLPHIKILHIGNNKIRDIKFLDAFKGLKLVELFLDGNPLCDKFKDKNVYVSEVRKRFPKVIKLDGVDLPPPILFDVADEECKMPASQQTFLCNEAGGDIVRTFLEQYFQIYDSDNRQPLSQAYHENAMYSMTMGYPYSMTQKSSPPLNWYQSDNRNLLRVHNIERRIKLLRQGQLSIISNLTEMPKTQHDMNSFKVDLSFFTPQFMMLNVTGVFKEIGGGYKTLPIRAFNRVLIIVAANSGFCIANEQIYITNATEEQMKEAFKVPQITPQSPPSQAQSPASISTPVLTAPQPDDITKQQMVQTLSQQTGMNIEFSTKCLQETNWDFQRATMIFTELQKQGGIPAEAFIK